MKTAKLFAIFSLTCVTAAGAAVAVGFLWPQAVATRYCYFDINNGLLKDEWVSFGRVYRQSVAETDYSKLLRRLNFQRERCDWRLANKEELGLRCWFFPQHVSYLHGKIAAQAYLFSRWVHLNEPESPMTLVHVRDFQRLISTGSIPEIQQYLLALQEEAGGGLELHKSR